MSLNRCSVFDKMPRKTLLALLGSKQVKLIHKNTIVSYTEANGQVKQYKVVEDFGDTVKVTDGVEILIIDKKEAITGNETFLDKFDTWRVSSYDSKRREVCVAAFGKVHFNITYQF